MKFLTLGALLVASAATLGAQGTVATPTVGDDKEVTFTGCVIRGEGGYVLAATRPHVTIESPTTTVGTSGTATTTTTTTTTTTPAPAAPIAPRVLYWFDDDDDIKDHVGQLVEVRGELEGDIDRGEIEMEIEEGLVELEFKVDGDKKVTVKVPHSVAAATPVGTSGVTPTDRPQDIPFTVYKVDVKKVRTIASTCTH